MTSVPLLLMVACVIWLLSAIACPDDRQKTREQDEIENVAVSASHGSVILSPGIYETGF